MILATFMSPKDSDNLSGARFTPASVRDGQTHSERENIIYVMC